MRRTNEADQVFKRVDQRAREGAGGGHGDRRDLPAARDQLGVLLLQRPQSL
jgi:hypothetical protein